MYMASFIRCTPLGKVEMSTEVLLLFMFRLNASYPTALYSFMVWILVSQAIAAAVLAPALLDQSSSTEVLLTERMIFL